MDLEIGQLNLRYEKLRRRSAHKERQLLASLCERGQQLPVVVCQGTDGDSYVLVDGYKRVRALRHLHEDLVETTLWELGEMEALLLERLMRMSESDGALEQGWLLAELNERFSLSHEELGRRFDKSQSWVSRRLALVRSVPNVVQELVRMGQLPAHAAMKYLVPMARAKQSDCERLAKALGTLQPSSRDIAVLYAHWSCGDKKTREFVVTHPAVALQAHAQAQDEKDSNKTPFRKLIDDFGILIGTSRRARAKLTQGVFVDLLPAEQEKAKRMMQQARFECEALFRSGSELMAAHALQRPLPGAAHAR